jgi:hypothetical protein
MRALIFIAGFLLCGLGVLAFRMSGDPSGPPLLQGGLTLGGGWVICGLFSLRAKWHGIIGAGMLAFLGGLRSLPALTQLSSGDPAAPFNVAAGVLCVVVFIAAARTLMAERRRQSIEALKAGDDDNTSAG